jgi:hypothetical protein
MNAAKRRNEKSSSVDTNPTEAVGVAPGFKGKLPLGNQGGQKMLFVGLLIFFGVLWISNSSNSSAPDQVSIEDMISAPIIKSSANPLRKSNRNLHGSSDIGLPDFAKASAKYKNCVVSFKPPPPKSKWTTKPLWLPSFPGSGSTGPVPNGDILKPLINRITGMKAGAKFYHASSKILKRCKGRDETATCAQSHPVVEIGPEKQADNFHSSVLLAIRNYRWALPTHMNDKAEAYHGAKGIMLEEDWRKNRDQWYKNVFEGWKKLIMTWKNMKEYDIGMYIQYEAIMDPKRGPATLQQIASQLGSAGFTVASEVDIPCIWYQVVKDEYVRLNDYWNYVPGYTAEQQDYLLQELDKFQKEVADDKALVAILKEYYVDIRDNTRIDKPWANPTASS